MATGRRWGFSGAGRGLAHKPDEAYPLDILGPPETEGMIGYLIEQELENALDHERTVCDASDAGAGGPRRPGLRRAHEIRGAGL